MRGKILKPLGISGFHSFRRFRVTHLRAKQVPEDIIRFWIGHASAGQSFQGQNFQHSNITDLYSKLAMNTALRQKWAFDAGVGFTFPHPTGKEAPAGDEQVPVWVSGFKE